MVKKEKIKNTNKVARNIRAINATLCEESYYAKKWIESQ